MERIPHSTNFELKMKEQKKFLIDACLNGDKEVMKLDLADYFYDMNIS
jgi:hypothetical protein